MTPSNLEEIKERFYQRLPESLWEEVSSAEKVLVMYAITAALREVADVMMVKEVSESELRYITGDENIVLPKPFIDGWNGARDQQIRKKEELGL